MAWTLHHRYGYPLWWDLSISFLEWALPLRVHVRPWNIDGSGRREHATNVEVSLLCLHWDVVYCWGRRRHRPAPARILSLREVLERDLAGPLTPGAEYPQNDA